MCGCVVYTLNNFNVLKIVMPLHLLQFSNLVTGAEQTTLLQNEDESFALAPVDASMVRGTMRAKRKRK